MRFPGWLRSCNIHRGERDPASEQYALGAMTSSMVQEAKPIARVE